MAKNNTQNWLFPEFNQLIGDNDHSLSPSPFSAQMLPSTMSTISSALYSWTRSAAVGAIQSMPLSLSQSPTPFSDMALSSTLSTYLPNSTNSTEAFPFNSSCISCLTSPESNLTAVQLNNTNSTAEQEQMERNIYILPLYQQIIWSFIFGSMVIAAAGGNIIVIWIVLTNKRMRTVTNYFLVNLSIADIMVSTLNVIFNFIYMLNADWPFGELYCKVTNFNAILSVGASVFTLMAISVDRYLAIVHPLRPRMSRTTTLNIIACIWIASSLLSLPNAIVSTTFPEKFSNGDSRVVCYLEWYDGTSTKSRLEYIYNVIILLVTYMVPIVSMSYTYFRVGRELWGSQSIGECTAKQMESIKSKRKIVKMMMIVVAIFGVCWAPYHIYFLLAHHYPQIINSKYVQHTYLTIYWLAMSNSVYNPLVYCWMNSRFRQGFKNIFCCACFGPKEQTIYDKPRYHGVARYSCASEACITDMRVRFNGNGNISTATLQATESTNVNGAGISKTSPLRARFSVNREML